MCKGTDGEFGLGAGKAGMLLRHRGSVTEAAGYTTPEFRNYEFGNCRMQMAFKSVPLDGTTSTERRRPRTDSSSRPQGLEVEGDREGAEKKQQHNPRKPCA